MPVCLPFFHHSSFNSTKVRLRRGFLTGRRTEPRFQFHKGSIKTVLIYTACRDACQFQFHKGSIKTTRADGGYRRTDSFNSTKVRLRPSVIDPISSVIDEFQFHKGSIKTFGLFVIVSLLLYCFNSTKVRLRRDQRLLYFFD